ncbi:MAG: hypothetical protein QXO99_08500 [Candidatus Methanomethylicia archaeon]
MSFYAPVFRRASSSIINYDTLNIPAGQTIVLLEVNGVGYLEVFQLKIPSTVTALNVKFNFEIDGVANEIYLAQIYNVTSPDIAEVRGHKGWNIVRYDSTGQRITISFNGIMPFSSKLKITIKNEGTSAFTISFYGLIVLEVKI